MKRDDAIKLLLVALFWIITLDAYAFSQNPCGVGSMAVSFDLSKTNNASIANQNTYIVVLGLNPVTQKYSYVKFHDGNTTGDLVDITDKKTNGKEYAIPLIQLVPRSGTMAQACIPYITSGRIYISFANSLDIPTEVQAGTGAFVPKQPDVNNPQTTTNGTLFDKVEFNYSLNGETVINPTGVDFIAIPYTIHQAGHEFGHSGGLDTVIQNMQSIVCNAAEVNLESPECTQRWKNSEWSKLIIYNEANQLMRIDAPGRTGNLFNGYFTNYITALSSYYTKRAIKIDLQELGQGIWSGHFEPNSTLLRFKSEDGKRTIAYDLGAPEASNAIFMGAQSPFNNSNAIDSTLARDLTAAIVSGMLMRKESAFLGKDFFDTQGNPVFKNKEQMENLIEYYFNNVHNSVDYQVNQCGKSRSQPCVNVYSEAMHALSTDINIEQPHESYLHSYAFSYDDFLGMDGTNTQTDATPAVIILGNMQGRSIPHVTSNFK